MIVLQRVPSQTPLPSITLLYYNMLLRIDSPALHCFFGQLACFLFIPVVDLLHLLRVQGLVHKLRHLAPPVEPEFHSVHLAVKRGFSVGVDALGPQHLSSNYLKVSGVGVRVLVRDENVTAGTPVNNDGEIQVSQEQCFVCVPRMVLRPSDKSMVIRDKPVYCGAYTHVRRPLGFHSLGHVQPRPGCQIAGKRGEPYPAHSGLHRIDKTRSNEMRRVHILGYARY